MNLVTTHAQRRRGAVLATAGTVACLVLSSCAALDGGAAGGEDLSSGTLNYVVPYEPGGSSDPVAREYSRLIAEDLGTDATVFNKPGGDEAIGITEVVNSDPDGHTIGLASSAGLLAQPLVHDSLQYDGHEDVTPIAQMMDTPYVLFVAAESPFDSLEELLDEARENPGEVRVGTANRMGNTAFSFYFLEKQADVDMTIVPAAGGSGESALAVMGGKIEAFLATGSGQLGLVESGHLKALAYTGDDYGDVLPDAQSFADAGYDIPFTADYLTIAPAGLPDDVREQLVASARSVAESDEWVAWSEKQGNIPAAIVGEELLERLEQKREDIKAAIALANAQG